MRRINEIGFTGLRAMCFSGSQGKYAHSYRVMGQVFMDIIHSKILTTSKCLMVNKGFGGRGCYSAEVNPVRTAYLVSVATL